MVLIQEDKSHEEHVIYYLSRGLTATEMNYSHVEKLALAAVQSMQRFRHYILLRKTTVISDRNPMQHILTKQVMGGKYSKWIIILQEFDLEFEKVKSNKSLVFAELIFLLPSPDTELVAEDYTPYETLFIIDTSDLWYGDIIRYLQTHKFASELTSSNRRRIQYQARQYIIVGDTLYCHGIDSIL